MARKSSEQILIEGLFSLALLVIGIVICAASTLIRSLFSLVYDPIKKKYDKKIAIINADKEAKRAKEELLANADKFFNYVETKSIPPELYQELLSEIYTQWNIHGVPQNIISKYEHYGTQLIDRLVNREKARISLRIKAHHYFKECAEKNMLWFDIIGYGEGSATGPGAVYFNCCCEYKEILKLNLTNELEYTNANGGIEYFDIVPNIMRYVRVSEKNKIAIYHENKAHTFTKKEFIKYRNINNVPLSLDERDSKQLEWRAMLKKKHIHFDESKMITYKFMEKTFGRKFN